jgi:ABC-type branched-subunit amino acid transport system permease subunit
VVAQDVITVYTLYWQFLLGIVVLAVVLFFQGGVMGVIEKYIFKRV